MQQEQLQNIWDWNQKQNMPVWVFLPVLPAMASFIRGKDVAVVGGGDTAAEEATYLAGLCRKVYLIVRRDELRASKVMQDKVFKSGNIEILMGTSDN